MAAAALVIGAGISAYGSYSAGEAKQRAYQMEAAAKRAQAAQVEIATNREVDLTQRRYERVRGAQASAWGRSGVQIGTGSPLMAMEETAADAASEILAIKNAGTYRKTSLLTEGILSGYLGDQAYQQGVLGAIGGGMSAFSKNPYSYDSGSIA